MEQPGACDGRDPGWAGGQNRTHTLHHVHHDTVHLPQCGQPLFLMTSMTCDHSSVQKTSTTSS